MNNIGALQFQEGHTSSLFLLCVCCHLPLRTTIAPTCCISLLWSLVPQCFDMSFLAFLKICLVLWFSISLLTYNPNVIRELFLEV